jgi:hypothetical protein
MWAFGIYDRSVGFDILRSRDEPSYIFFPCGRSILEWIELHVGLSKINHPVGVGKVLVYFLG